MRAARAKFSGSHLGGPRSRLTWLIGAAVLAAVVAGALNLTDGREFVRIAEHAEPAWLLVALVLQASTYFLQGAIWQCVGRAGGIRLSTRFVLDLSLAELTLDQALPSGGVSGTVFVSKVLQEHGLPRSLVAGGVIARTSAYYAAYALSLGAALAMVLFSAEWSRPLIWASLAFCALAGAIAIVLPALTRDRKHIAKLNNWRIRPARKLLRFLTEADPKLARSPRLLAITVALQLGNVLLDVLTIWVLLLSMGASVGIQHVFASFMLSSLFRTLGIAPGGLGTFEASSVITLHAVGVPVAVALSATLMFRVLSFWLPMVPGFWSSHRVRKVTRTQGRRAKIASHWSLPVAQLASALGSRIEGLTDQEAQERLMVYGPNVPESQGAHSRLKVLWAQLKSPLLLLLIFACTASAIAGEWVDACIVLTIVLVTVLIGFVREYKAESAIAALQARVRSTTSVLRGGLRKAIPVAEVVPGDVVLLSAGSLVPGDGLLFEANDCYASEAMLTGESFPVEKRVAELPVDTELGGRTNCVFQGTNIRSGVARCLVVQTGNDTQLGSIAHQLGQRPPETEFDRGIRRFGYLLTSTMLVMVFSVFAVHMLRGRPVVETLLFAIALAVGLSPELLPAILSLNLARGAESMAKRGVLVRRLNAIENLGSMDILCTDKTGTLTEGEIRLEGAYDSSGQASPRVLDLAALNASLESGLRNPLDDAIVQAAPICPVVEKLAEVPFDFMRKRLSVVVRDQTVTRLITKGAFAPVLELCTHTAAGQELDPDERARITAAFEAWSAKGVRVLAVATRDMPPQESFGRDDERELRFEGMLTFSDRPKVGVQQAIADLGQLGVAVKLITGDTRLVAQHVASLVGLNPERVLTGQDLHNLHDDALPAAAERTDLFVEVDPNQKERIITALRKRGHVVGFMGDGVNDAPAMHAADTSISVDSAVEVAREAADFVLLDRDLDVIRRGIEDGRRTFANTLKYILTTTSANLGNMVSMAIASLFLPFLPLLAGQILLNNFLSDIPAFGIAGDSVDRELVDHPRRWNMGFIGRFMIEFGFLSTAFDMLTFATLLLWFHAGVAGFRTGWFVESLLTELVIALVVRTRRPFFRSRPGNVLLASTLLLIPLALVLPYVPGMGLFGLAPLPAPIMAALVGITAFYVVAAEIAKHWFYRVHTRRPDVRGGARPWVPLPR